MRPTIAVLSAALTVPLLTSPAQAAPGPTARLGKNFATWNGRTLYVHDREDDRRDVYAYVAYHSTTRGTMHYDLSGYSLFPSPSKYLFSTAASGDIKQFRVCESVRGVRTGCGDWVPRPGR